ncbi:MAG: hypothetical protein ACOX7N_06300 [Lawsonibacter sp.]|jgi:hypothetical protein
MEQVEKEQLCQKIKEADLSLGFIGILLTSVGLSWRATAVQREGLERMLCEGAENMPDVTGLRLPASLLVVVALTFFFVLSLEGWENSKEQTCQVQYSATLNVWAALFVLAAALLRLYDLTQVQARISSDNGEC